MRIAVAAIGSRGDVQPFLALALGLQQAGHNVRMATHATFAAEIEARGLRYAPLEGDIRALLEGGQFQSSFEAGSNPFAFMTRFNRVMEPVFRRSVSDMLAVARDVDFLLLGGLSYYSGLDVAQKLDLPYAIAAVQPMPVTRSFASPFFPQAPSWLPLRGAYNRFTYLILSYLLWLPLRRAISVPRQQLLGLGPAPLRPPVYQLYRPGTLSLYGFSPAVVPPPADWRPWFKVTGYWFLDAPAGWEPSPELVDFLRAGPSPVYIGFGSMNDREAERLTAIALEALRRTGQRGLLATGWGGVRGAHNRRDIHTVEAVPHDWLFPHVAAAVHHGGAGTTAAALRAGVPSVIVPFLGDQPFWGYRVHTLAAGTAPIPRKRLTAERLAAAITQAVEEPTLRAGAAALGRQIRAEDGIGCAVAALNRYW